MLHTWALTRARRALTHTTSDKTHSHTKTAKSAAAPILSGFSAARGGAQSGARPSQGPPPP
eukprot:6593548-Prymnesium_polylepis.1